jgi:hypothetical protein
MIPPDWRNAFVEKVRRGSITSTRSGKLVLVVAAHDD